MFTIGQNFHIFWFFPLSPY